MGAFAKLKQLLEEKDSFVLVCHVEPDGDAIGAMSALGRILLEKGKKVHFFCKDEVPAVFNFLIEDLKVCATFPSIIDAVILLDNGDARRTGIHELLPELKKSKRTIINIDHHPKNDLWKISSINYAKGDASSTCEILTSIFEGLNYEISPEIATALLAGIFYDTGGFRHSNTSMDVLDTVAGLLRKGAKLKKITDRLANTKSLSLLRLWGIALKRVRLSQSYCVSVSVLTARDIEDSKATEEEVSGLVNLLNSAPESRAALLLYESSDGKIKGSLRTERDDLDVSRLAKALGGGGHKKAAGFTINGRIKIDGSSWKII